MDWKDLRGHNRKDDAWLSIEGKVYDITSWIPFHPGGDVILQFAGKDATDAFLAFHEPRVKNGLKRFEIGTLKVKEEIPEDLKDFRDLRDRLWTEGWFEPRLDGLIMTASLILFTALASLWWTLRCPSFLSHMFGACMLGVFWTQCLLFAHDFCHRCATRSKVWDKRLGPIFGTFLGGVGAGWWNRDHNMHHAVTQIVDADPSAGCPPILCTDKLQFKSSGWGAKLMLKLQAYYYIPLCVLIGRYNLHIVSLVLCPPKYRARDCFLMAGYFTYVFKLLSCLPGSERWPYYLVANSVTGVLHLVLNMNHYSMPMQPSVESAEQMGFFRFQLTGTCNIRSNALQRWYYGGLEHQIEHHLFPLMPRYNLPLVKRHVEMLAKKHGIPYQTFGFFGANLEVIRALWYL